MERFDNEQDDELIDLGSATVETKGPPVSGKDTHGGINLMGLSND